MEDTQPVFERVRGYKDALKEFKLEVDEDLIVGDSFSEENGYIETKLLLKNNKKPTAIFGLSNLISFKRDLETKDLYDELDKCQYCTVALDAEFFGHHFSDGFVILDSIVERIFKTGGEFTTVSEYVHAMKDNHFKVSEIKESTWGSLWAESSFRIWNNKDNNVHAIQWDIIYELVTDIRKELNIENKYYDPSEHETLAIWLPSEMQKVKNDDIKAWFRLHKIIFSDWFWWASKEKFPDGKVAYDPEFVIRGLDVMAEMVREYGSETLKVSFEKKKALLLNEL